MGGDEIMATAGATAAAAAVAMEASSSYRVKFRRKEFLELVEIAKPKIIYHRGRMHFFAFDGFVMYTFECRDSDFKQKVIHAIEFSNRPWDE
jgi:hypothetical protein